MCWNPDDGSALQITWLVEKKKRSFKHMVNVLSDYFLHLKLILDYFAWCWNKCCTACERKVHFPAGEPLTTTSAYRINDIARTCINMNILWIVARYAEMYAVDTKTCSCTHWATCEHELSIKCCDKGYVLYLPRLIILAYSWYSRRGGHGGVGWHNSNVNVNFCWFGFSY